VRRRDGEASEGEVDEVVDKYQVCEQGMSSKFKTLQIANLTAEPVNLSRELRIEPFSTAELDRDNYAADPDLMTAINFAIRAGRISVTPTLPTAEPKAA
jgi:hypothetical protein